MPRDLEINITVNDQGAKESLGNVDQATDKLTQSIGKTRAEVAALEGGLKSMGQMVGQEQARLAAMESQLSGNVDKMKQFGVQNVSAAESQRALGVETEQTTEKMGQMESMVQRIILRMAVLMAIRGSFQFVEGIVASAHETDKFAEALDLSTTRVQQLGYAAGQADLPLSAMTNAVDTLQKRLAGDNKGAIESLEKMGIDIDRLKTMSGEQVFDTVAAAVAQLGDRLERTGAEVKLFGTDRIDPVIKKLDQFKDEANAANVILDRDQVKALDDAGKGWDILLLKMKAVTAEYVLQAGVWNRKPGPDALGVDDVKGPRPDVPSMSSLPFSDIGSQGLGTNQFGGQSSASGSSAGRLGLRPPDPTTKQGMAEILALEREITHEVDVQISAELKQLAFEKTVFAEREQLYKRIQAEMLKTSEMYAKVTNDAVVAELGAKERNLAAQGLDIHGTPIALTETPLAKAARAQHDLDVSKQTSPGINSDERAKEIQRTFLEEGLKLAQADDAAAAAANKLSAAHMGAVRAADETSNAFDHFKGVLMAGLDASPQERDTRNAPLITPDVGIFTGSSVGQFSGSGVGIGGFPLITASGRSAGLTNGTSTGGFSMGDVIIQGNVNNEATARLLADQVAQKVMDRLQSQSKSQLTKR